MGNELHLMENDWGNDYSLNILINMWWEIGNI